MSDHPYSGDQLMTLFGDRDAERRSAIAAHVAGCAECAATLGRLDLIRATVRTDASLEPSATALTRVKGLMASRRRIPRDRPSAFASLKELVATLVFDGRTAAAAAGSRGGWPAYVLRYALDELDVDLEVEPRGDGDQSPRRVTGQISGDSAEPTVDLALAFAEPGSRWPIVETRSNDAGVFFAELSPGSYDLLIALGEDLVVVPNLDVG